MRKAVVWPCIIFLAFFVLSFVSTCYAEEIKADFDCPTMKDSAKSTPIAQMDANENKEIAQQPLLWKKIIGEVFMYKYSGPLYDLVKCENYQIYLLKDIEPGSKGELILDSKKSSFDVTLSTEKLKDYLNVEFVSAYGNKIIKLNEIKDGKLEIILKPEVFIKKPAIYLYPYRNRKYQLFTTSKGRY